MVENPINKAMKDLNDAMEKVGKDFQKSIQGYIYDTIDLPKLLEMVKGMGVPLQGKNVPGFDPYKVLGLDAKATNKEVKERYSELLFKLHPDTAGKKGTEFLVQMVIVAYEMIEKERGWQ